MWAPFDIACNGDFAPTDNTDSILRVSRCSGPGLGVTLRSMRTPRFAGPEWLVMTGGSLFIFSLTVSAIFVPEIRWLHLVQSIALCWRHNTQSPAESLGLFHRRIHCGFLGSTCTVCFAALRRDLRSPNAARPSSSGTCIRGESGGCDRLYLGVSQAGRQVPPGSRQAHPDIHRDNRAPNRSHCNSSARLPCRFQ